MLYFLSLFSPLVGECGEGGVSSVRVCVSPVCVSTCVGVGEPYVWEPCVGEHCVCVCEPCVGVYEPCVGVGMGEPCVCEPGVGVGEPCESVCELGVGVCEPGVGVGERCKGVDWPLTIFVFISTFPSLVPEPPTSVSPGKLMAPAHPHPDLLCG